MSTKTDILDAAENIFARRGFSGTSMSSISDEAGVSKGLLYHHFGSKMDLWEQVVQRRVTVAGLQDKILETVAILVREGTDAVMSTGKHDMYFDFLRKNPQFVRMLAWINAERSLPMGPPLELREQVLGNLKELQKTGVFRDDIDPRMFVVVFMAVCEHWFLFRDRIAVWFGEEHQDDELDSEYIEAALKIMLFGMAGGK